MKSKLVAAAGIAGTLALAPAAGAVVKAGDFAGKTDHGQPVTFKVTRGKKLTEFSFRRFKLSCTDGDVVPLGKVGSGPDKITITKAGKFSFDTSYEDGDKWTASGTINGARAKGKVRFTVRFDSEGNPSKDGEVLCDSGSRRFTARLR